MAAARKNDWVAKVREFRDVATLHHDGIANISEELESISKFLQDHETTSTGDVTHSVFDQYPDWWMTRGATFKLAIAEDNTLELFYKHIATLYSLGVPLTLQEKLTPEMKLVQDIQIWGSADNGLSADDLMRPECAFMQLLGSVIAEVYRGNGAREDDCAEGEELLDAFVFDASGKCSKKVYKTSIRVVWPWIVVNRDQALYVRDCVVKRFRSSQEPAIRELAQTIQAQNPNNDWACVFGDSIYNGKHGIRMPLNDIVQPAPMKKPEKRPFAPWGVLRVKYTQERAVLKGIERLADPSSLSGLDWLKHGCARQPTGTDVTPSKEPVTFSGPSVAAGPRSGPATGFTNGDGASASGAPSSKGKGGGKGGGAGRGYTSSFANRNPGRAQVRGHGGSPGDNNRPRVQRPAGDQAPPTPAITIKRQFVGNTVEEFLDRLRSIGANMIEELRDENEVRITIGLATITFTAHNRLIVLQGQTKNLRSVVDLLKDFAVEPESDGRSTVGSRAGSRPGSEANSRTGGGTQAYVPSAAFAPSQAYQPSTASQSMRMQAEAAGSAEGLRTVIRDFKGENSGELDLNNGDTVVLSHDPGSEGSDLHRWVYGTNQVTQEQGWFPLSSTVPADEAA